jgi:AcrR family transcriptional regulator
VTRLPPKYLPADERRSLTVDTVVTLAGQQNPSEITTAAIAEHMRVTQGALFRHFPTKDAIWQAVMQWIADRLLDRFDRAVSGIASPVESLRAAFLSQVEFAIEHSGVPRLMFGELQHAKATPAKTIARTLVVTPSASSSASKRPKRRARWTATSIPPLRRFCSSGRSRGWSCSRCCPETSRARAPTRPPSSQSTFAA